METPGKKVKLAKLTGAIVRARVRSGKLELLEDLDLPEGEEIEVRIRMAPMVPNADGLRRSAGTWKGNVAAEKLIENIYADRLVSTRPIPRL